MSQNLNITQIFIPMGRRNRPGRANPMNYITVHETGNPRAGANARAHANWLNATNDLVSYHCSVDDTETVQHLPENEDAFHAGDGGGNGNRQSIGIEICVNSDGNFKRAIERTAELVADICKRRDIPIEKVRQHFNWSGKNCPQNIRAGRPVNWEAFISMVRAYLELDTEPPTAERFPTDPANVQRMVDLGVITSPDYWLGVDNIQWLNELLSNAGRENVLHRGVDNGIADFETAIDVLTKAGVMTSPDYWRGVVAANKSEWLRQLIMGHRGRWWVRVALFFRGVGVFGWSILV